MTNSSAKFGAPGSRGLEILGLTLMVVGLLTLFGNEFEVWPHTAFATPIGTGVAVFGVWAFFRGRLPIAARVTLLPLDAEVIQRRLSSNDFRLDRTLEGGRTSLWFGPEFPGDALVLYPRFLEAAGANGSVDGTFVIVDPACNAVVGQLGTLGSPDGDTVEIGYGINAAARGRGFATAAVADLVKDLRARPTVHQIIARTAVTNPASGRVLEKNDFAVTGREHSAEGELLVWAHTPAT